MKTNIGNIDRILRGSAALLIILLYLAKVIQGQAAIFLGLIALVLLFTSVSSFCPCYVRLNINTRKEKE
jgi:hypothetical protein